MLGWSACSMLACGCAQSLLWSILCQEIKCATKMLINLLDIHVDFSFQWLFSRLQPISQLQDLLDLMLSPQLYDKILLKTWLTWASLLPLTTLAFNSLSPDFAHRSEMKWWRTCQTAFGPPSRLPSISNYFASLTFVKNC